MFKFGGRQSSPALGDQAGRSEWPEDAAQQQLLLAVRKQPQRCVCHRMWGLLPQIRRICTAQQLLHATFALHTGRKTFDVVHWLIATSLCLMTRAELRSIPRSLMPGERGISTRAHVTLGTCRMNRKSVASITRLRYRACLRWNWRPAAGSPA